MASDPVSERAAARVAATWAELGFRVRGIRYMLFVRTEPLPQRTASGRIWLPNRLTNFFNDLPNKVYTRAVVCSAGPTATSKWGIRESDRIFFRRQDFAWYRKMADNTYFGWVEAPHVLGYPYDDDPEAERLAFERREALNEGYAFA